MYPSEDAGEITRLLHDHRAGSREAFDRLVSLVYGRLHRIARGQLARGGRQGALDTTALVHEAYVQLVEETGVEWQDRSHFFAICARSMRRIVVDYARQRAAQKRGGGVPDVTLEPDLAGAEEQAELVLAVDRAMERLAGIRPRLAQVVECRYFAGMTEDETAAALATSVRTVQREWRRARAWLRRDLGPPGAGR